MKEQTAHTPGPWEIIATGTHRMSVKADMASVATVSVTNVKSSFNARLIAAAPDLLEVLLEIKQHGLSWDDRYDAVIEKAKGAA